MAVLSTMMIFLEIPLTPFIFPLAPATSYAFPVRFTGLGSQG